MGSLQSSAAAAMLSLAVSVPGISATASTGQPVAGWWLNLVPQVLLLDDDVIEEADPCSTGYEVRDLIGPAGYTTRFVPSQARVCIFDYRDEWGEDTTVCAMFDDREAVAAARVPMP